MLIIDIVLNFFFPPRCISCNKNDSILCNKCKNKIIFTPYKDTSIINLDTYIACNKSQLLKLIIHRFKYSYKEELNSILGDLLIKTLQTFNISKNYILVPIPLHISRKFWRGFNQAELLAKTVSKTTHIPVYNLLKRIRKTHTQAKLNKISRIKNMHNVFTIKNNIFNNNITNKKIILVDDITTTGATFNSASQILRDAGFKEIYGLAICKGL